MASSREIRTSQEVVACDVCGRTLLRGEHTETWLAGGSRREVCELCTPRARHEGWVREGARLEMPARTSGGERRRSLLGRLRERGERLVPSPAGEGDGDGAEEAAEAPPAPPARPRSAPPAPAPAVAEREPRHIHAVPTAPEHRTAAALEIFNASDYPRTVAGVARSLGVPGVTVRPVPGGSRVAVVVAWELSWYRYEVDLGNPGAGVERTAQGYELSELPDEDRIPNAQADEYGRLRLGAS